MSLEQLLKPLVPFYRFNGTAVVTTADWILWSLVEFSMNLKATVSVKSILLFSDRTSINFKDNFVMFLKKSV